MNEAPDHGQNRPSDEEVRGILRQITGFSNEEIDKVVAIFRRELGVDYIDLCRPLSGDYMNDPHVKAAAARVEARIDTTLKINNERN